MPFVAGIRPLPASGLLTPFGAMPKPSASCCARQRLFEHDLPRGSWAGHGRVMGGSRKQRRSRGSSATSWLPKIDCYYSMPWPSGCVHVKVRTGRPELSASLPSALTDVSHSATP